MTTTPGTDTAPPTGETGPDDSGSLGSGPLDGEGPQDERLTQLSVDLVIHAARLIRQIRRTSPDSSPALRMLSLLEEQGPLGVSRLAQADGTAQPTATATVNGLLARGWVTKEPHPDDYRSTLVRMTAEGREALELVRRRNAAAVSARLVAAGHDVDELERAVSLLRDLTEGPQ